jgi:N-acetylneuraminate synthase
LPTWFESISGRCFVIAEVAQNHDGSLGTAHSYIDGAVRAGADAIKFQTHIAAAESTLAEPWRVRFSPQDATRYDYWKRTEFNEEQWRGLADHAKERGLVFLSSAFSLEAVDLLERLDVPVWKIGAGEIGNLVLIERMARTGKPVLLSSGVASWNDLDTAVDVVRQCGAPVAVLQCTTAYPCPPEKLGLNIIPELRERYRCPVGLSDHSGTIYAGLAAATVGIDMLEVHVVFSRECFGPDVRASVTTGELSQLTEGIRFIEKARANPVNKEAMARELSDLRSIFSHSVTAARDLPAGSRLTETDLALKKPGTGIPAQRLKDVVNRRLKRAVTENTLLCEDDFELDEAS